MRTIITHFYNEEYLLPWWLEHHKKYFDHGILIDYHSTDNSVSICKEICPTWEVVTSRNLDFQAETIDDEVLSLERSLEGWRIALNVTEFLVGDINKVMYSEGAKTQYLIPSITFFDWNPEGELRRDLPLWDQKTKGIHYKDNFKARRARSLHNYFTVRYPLGRHYEKFNCEDVLVFHYANCISSPGMVQRRLQIQNKIPAIDVARGLGHQHHNFGKGLTLDSLKEFNERELDKISDCQETIIKYTK